MKSLRAAESFVALYDVRIAARQTAPTRKQYHWVLRNALEESAPESLLRCGARGTQGIRRDRLRSRLGICRLAALSVTAVLEFTRQRGVERGQVRRHVVLGGGDPDVYEATAAETVMTPVVPGPVCTPITGPRVRSPISLSASGPSPFSPTKSVITSAPSTTRESPASSASSSVPAAATSVPSATAIASPAETETPSALVSRVARVTSTLCMVFTASIMRAAISLGSPSGTNATAAPNAVASDFVGITVRKPGEAAAAAPPGQDDVAIVRQQKYMLARCPARCVQQLLGRLD